MRRFRLVAGPGLILLLFQTLVWSSGRPCPFAGDVTPGHEDASMDGMQMPPAQGPTDEDRSVPGDQVPPCKLPWAPGGCSSYAPCAPVLLPGVAGAPSGVGFAVEHARIAGVLKPASRTVRPELPPPRS